MASLANASSSVLSPDLSEAASRPAAARLQVRMGRAVSVGEGINWLTLAVPDRLSSGRGGGALLLHLAAADGDAGALRAGHQCRHRHVLPPPADPSRLPGAQVAGILAWPSAPRSRSRAARSSGWPLIASITSSATARATRTLPAKAAGGRTSAGSSGATRCTRRPRLLARYVPDLSRDRFYRLAEQVPLDSAHRQRRAAVRPGLAVRAAGRTPWECCCGAAFCA